MNTDSNPIFIRENPWLISTPTLARPGDPHVLHAAPGCSTPPWPLQSAPEPRAGESGDRAWAATESEKSRASIRHTHLRHPARHPLPPITHPSLTPATDRRATARPGPCEFPALPCVGPPYTTQRRKSQSPQGSLQPLQTRLTSFPAARYSPIPDRRQLVQCEFGRPVTRDRIRRASCADC